MKNCIDIIDVIDIIFSEYDDLLDNNSQEEIFNRENREKNYVQYVENDKFGYSSYYSSKIKTFDPITIPYELRGRRFSLDKAISISEDNPGKFSIVNAGHDVFLNLDESIAVIDGVLLPYMPILFSRYFGEEYFYLVEKITHLPVSLLDAIDYMSDIEGSKVDLLTKDKKQVKDYNLNSLLNEKLRILMSVDLFVNLYN